MLKKESDTCRRAASRCRHILVAGLLMYLIGCSQITCAAKEATFAPPKGTQRVCLSLRVLSGEVSKASAMRSSPSEDCLALAGIGFLEGYILDDTSPGDMILVGLRSESHPSLRLDDLVVSMRSLGEPGTYPYCSLDPRPEDILALQRLLAEDSQALPEEGLKASFERIRSAVGPQQVVAGGVPRNSRFAHVMVDADYHMKKVSQGHIPLAGITSYLDLSRNAIKDNVLNGKNTPLPAMSMARFWFHAGAGSPSFQEGKGVIWLAKCPVVLLTEKQMATSSGKLVDMKDDDPIATAFSNELSTHFCDLTQSVPIYADLENLFRLRAIVLAMEFRHSLSAAGIDSDQWLTRYNFCDEKPMEASLPGLANCREWTHSVSVGDEIRKYSVLPMVCGGVEMDIRITAGSFSETANAALTALRADVLRSRPSGASLSWQVSQYQKVAWGAHPSSEADIGGMSEPPTAENAVADLWRNGAGPTTAKRIPSHASVCH